MAVVEVNLEAGWSGVGEGGVAGGGRWQGEVRGESAGEEDRGGEGAGSSGGGGRAGEPSLKFTQLHCTTSDPDLGVSAGPKTLSKSGIDAPPDGSDNGAS